MLTALEKDLLIIVEAEPLCDLLMLAFVPTDTGLQAYARPATPQQTTIFA